MFEENTNSTAATAAMTLAALNGIASAAASTASASATPSVGNGVQSTQIVNQLLNAKDSRLLRN